MLLGQRSGERFARGSILRQNSKGPSAALRISASGLDAHRRTRALQISVQKEKRTPSSMRRAVSAATGCPTFEEARTEFTVVTLVWLNRFALRAFNVKVRGLSLSRGLSVNARLRFASRWSAPGMVPMSRGTLPLTVLLVSN